MLRITVKFVKDKISNDIQNKDKFFFFSITIPSFASNAFMFNRNYLYQSKINPHFICS